MNKKRFYDFLLLDVVKKISEIYSYALIDENLLMDIKEFIKKYVKEKYFVEIPLDAIIVQFNGDSLMVDINIDSIPEEFINKIVISNIEQFV